MGGTLFKETDEKESISEPREMPEQIFLPQPLE